jgi:hypothetical protein
MTTRTFKQFGHAYGAEPAQITVRINAQEIFSGDVATVDEPFPEKLLAEAGLGSELFVWTEDSAFAGTRAVEITVTRGSVILTSTHADHTIAAAPEEFDHFYIVTQDGVDYTECMSNVAVNGVALPRAWDGVNVGQYHCHLAEGSVYTATINITAAPTAE